MGRAGRGPPDPVPAGLGAVAGRRCPTAIEVVGVPDRRRARRERRALPPCPRRRVHGQAHRRGRAADGTWPWVSELPADAVADLPDALDGATFLDRWGTTDDAVTTVDPDETYPVRAATTLRRRGAPAAAGARSTRSTRATSPRSAR